MSSEKSLSSISSVVSFSQKHSHLGLRLGSLVLCAGLVAGCSSDANRFSNLFANTNSAKSAPAAQGYPTQSVQAAPLSEPAQTPYRNPVQQASYSPARAQSNVPSSVFKAPNYTQNTQNSFQQAPSYTQPTAQPQSVASQPSYAQPKGSAFYTGSVQRPQSLQNFNSARQQVPQTKSVNDLAETNSSYRSPSSLSDNVAQQDAAPQGGSVRVQQGDTLYAISRRTGVSVSQLQAANHLDNASHIRVGQVLALSGAAQNSSPASQTQKAAVRAVKQPQMKPQQDHKQGFAHKVRAGDTIYGLGRHYNVAPSKILAANNLNASQTLSIGQRVVIPGDQAVLAKTPQISSTSKVASRNVQTQNQFVAKALSPSAYQSASLPQKRSAEVKTQFVEAEPKSSSSSSGARLSLDRAQAITSAPSQKKVEAARASVKPSSVEVKKGVETASLAAPSLQNNLATPQFRWPIRGRVISPYGSSSNGERNDGINIAVPEGASVRAAEDGEVVYAGNELKGYGNLILLRHVGGWVTAYAHNSELTVKRGDQIKRGQIVARAGKTGSVETPQLHFEVRKGSEPVDPMPFLNGVNGQYSALR